MRNFFVPHSAQVDRVAARPFFMVMASMSLDGVLALHFMQKIWVAAPGAGYADFIPAGPRRRRIASPRAHACADMDQERG